MRAKQPPMANPRTHPAPAAMARERTRAKSLANRRLKGSGTKHHALADRRTKHLLRLDATKAAAEETTSNHKVAAAATMARHHQDGAEIARVPRLPRPGTKADAVHTTKSPGSAEAKLRRTSLTSIEISANSIQKTQGTASTTSRLEKNSRILDLCVLAQQSASLLFLRT